MEKKESSCYKRELWYNFKNARAFPFLKKRKKDTYKIKYILLTLQKCVYPNSYQNKTPRACTLEERKKDTYKLGVQKLRRKIMPNN